MILEAVSHNDSDNASTKIVINNASDRDNDSESDNNSYNDIGINSDSDRVWVKVTA